VVVPELAEVPVFRTVTVQVPLGEDVDDASFCATNGDPPSLTDIIMSTAGEAVAAGAGVMFTARRTTHAKATANARVAAFVQARSRGISTAASKSYQAAPPGRQVASV
jgi:hypothetical protein